jgi:hypothetical protein
MYVYIYIYIYVYVRTYVYMYMYVQADKALGTPMCNDSTLSRRDKRAQDLRTQDKGKGGGGQDDGSSRRLSEASHSALSQPEAYAAVC